MNINMNWVKNRKNYITQEDISKPELMMTNDVFLHITKMEIEGMYVVDIAKAQFVVASLCLNSMLAQILAFFYPQVALHVVRVFLEETHEACRVVSHHPSRTKVKNLLELVLIVQNPNVRLNSSLIQVLEKCPVH